MPENTKEKGKPLVQELPKFRGGIRCIICDPDDAYDLDEASKKILREYCIEHGTRHLSAPKRQQKRASPTQKRAKSVERGEA